MNWNPYKRPDYKNMTDAELDAAEKGFNTKQKITFGINVVALVIACAALAAIVFPAAGLPAIPVYISNFMIAGSLFSSTRFSKLGRECRTEKLDRTLASLSQQSASLANTPATPAPQPAPAPKAPDFNHAAATVLDDDLEINRPLQFKKKAPGATA